MGKVGKYNFYQKGIDDGVGGILNMHFVGVHCPCRPLTTLLEFAVELSQQAEADVIKEAKRLEPDLLKAGSHGLLLSVLNLTSTNRGGRL